MRAKVVAGGIPLVNTFSLILFAFIQFVPLTLTSSRAQVPPITPSGLNTQVNLSATPPAGKVQYDITGGTRPGGGLNLFHSFGEFGVPPSNIASFLNGVSFDLNGAPLATGLQTSNILGRVTGTIGNNPTLSIIYGTIQTSGFGNANLFLMNPAGFLFGPNATVNVGGMVAFTSADYLRLADGAQFNALPNATADALLTASPVAAFGFLGSSPGAITVQGGQFTVTEGAGISLVGGNITIESGTPDGGTAQPARLSAPNGKIQLASAASPGEFDATTPHALPNVNGASFTSFGSVSLKTGSTVDVSGTNTVSIRGGQFVLTVSDAMLTTAESPSAPDTISLSRESSIVTSNAGADPGADVQLVASNIQMDGASITSTTTGEGIGGAISITGRTISLTNGAQVVTNTSGAGTGGAISITAGDTVTISGYDVEGALSGITTFLAPFLVRSGLFTTSSSTGNGGDVSVTAPSILVENAGAIASNSTITNPTGRGGNLLLVANSVDLVNAGGLESTNGIDLTTFEPLGIGQGGDITIAARDSVRLSGFEPDLFLASTISSGSFNNAKGGDLVISAPTVVLEGGALVGTTGVAEGPGGSIFIHAEDSLSVSGNDPLGNASQILTDAAFADGGAINIQAGSVSVSGGLILASAQGGTTSGDITLQVDRDVSVLGGGVIGAALGTISSGDILVAADAVSISGVQGDSASRIENVNGGEAATGDITISAREVAVIEGGRINSESGALDGNITIAATESVTVSSQAKIRMENKSGQAGLIDISAPTITLDQGIIQTQTVADSSGGNVNLLADNLTMTGSFINSGADNSTESFRSGNVTINVTETFSILRQFNGSSTDVARPAGIYATAGALGGDAGLVSITAGTLNVANGARIVTNTSSAGAGGAMIIRGENTVFLTGPGTGLFSETTGSGPAGVITVQAPQFQITDGAIISAKSTGSGKSGSVTIEGTQSPANSVVISGSGSGIFTDTQGTGAGGDINLFAQSFTLQNGATVSAATFGTSTSATGGTIMVNAIVQDGAIIPTAAQSVTLSNGASISTSSTGPANAGDIVINAGQNYTSTGSAVTTQAAQASGGNITVLATDQVYLTNSQLNASVQGSSTTVGGNIVIDPQFVILQNSQIIAQATQGQGGSISITTNVFLPDSSSIVSASSQSGVNGTVNIQSPISQAGGKIVPLANQPLEASALLSQRCAALASGQYSSFVVAGRYALPTDPGGWLSSPLAFTSLEAGSVARRSVSEPDRLAQATDTVSLRMLPPGTGMPIFSTDLMAGCTS